MAAHPCRVHCKGLAPMEWPSEKVQRSATEAVGSTPLRCIQFKNLAPYALGTVHQAGVLNESNLSDFARDLGHFVEKHPGRALLLSFKHVDYLSSAVLTELMRAHKALLAGGGSLSVCCLNKNIREV